MFRLKTNLRCGACVASLKPLLDGEPGILNWSADVNSPDKVLTVEGSLISRNRIEQILAEKGYAVLGEANVPAEAPPLSEPPTSYFPLLLILLYLLAGVGVLEYAHGTWDGMRAMRHFMAGFFLVFSFFKLLNVRAFADAYQSYDIVAKLWPVYGLVYPFLELLLGLAYLANLNPFYLNIVTLLIMGVSTIGVLQSVLSRRKIRCACLGTVFNLPMSFITLVEDLLMVVMALLMLVLPAAGH